MKPIFIAGTGRSGTTILKQTFLQHPQIIGLPNELRVLTDPGGALDLADALSAHWGPYAADSAIHRFLRLIRDASVPDGWRRKQQDRFQLRVMGRFGYAPRRYIGASLSHYPDRSYLHHRLQVLIESLTSSRHPGRWMGTPAFARPSIFYETEHMEMAQAVAIVAQFFTDLYGHIATPAHTHWLDDTPTALLHAHRLARLYPDMRLIHIVRDPRDVLASYVGFAWGGNDFVTAARRLAAYYQRWLQVREYLPPDTITQIHLEALAADPDKILQRLCEFVRVPFDPILLTIPFDQVNAGRWQNDIPAATWRECEPLLLPYVQHFGYA